MTSREITLIISIVSLSICILNFIILRIVWFIQDRKEMKVWRIKIHNRTIEIIQELHDIKIENGTKTSEVAYEISNKEK